MGRCRNNLTVEIVSRDRSALYADGITRGAPTARQVADRFHLLRSLREALERLLDGQGAARRAALAPPAAASAGAGTTTPAPATEDAPTAAATPVLADYSIRNSILALSQSDCQIIMPDGVTGITGQQTGFYVRESTFFFGLSGDMSAAMLSTGLAPWCCSRKSAFVRLT